MSRISGNRRARATSSAVNASGRSLTMTSPAPPVRTACENARSQTGVKNAGKPSPALARPGSQAGARRPQPRTPGAPDPDGQQYQAAQGAGGPEQRAHDDWVARIEQTVDQRRHAQVTQAGMAGDLPRFDTAIPEERPSLAARQEPVGSRPV